MAWYEKATDDFQRASLGATWTTRFGSAMVIASSSYITAGGYGDAVSYYNAVTPSANQYASLYWSANAIACGSAVRCSTSANTSYFSQCNATNAVNIYKVVAGSFTKLGVSLPGVASFPADLKLEVNGTTLTHYINGTPQDTRTDSAIASGMAGVYAVFTTEHGDSFAMGDDQAPAGGGGGTSGLINRSMLVNRGGYGGAHRGSLVN